MNNSVLLTVLDRLNSTEIRQLSKFLRSPYFNQREDVVLLFDYIQECRALKIERLDKKKAFQKVYPQATYQDAKIRHLMSYLLQLVKDFLVQENDVDDVVSKKIHLCQALRKKGLNRLFEKEWKKTHALQDQQAYRNTHFYYNNYKLYLERSEYLHQHQRTGEMNLQEVTDELTTFYIADLLRQSCSVLAHQSLSPQHYDLKLVEPVLQLVDSGGLRDIPAISIYYHCYRALKDLNNEADFYALPPLIKANWQQFPNHEIRDILLLAINYCIQKLNSGERKFIREAFELYRFGLAHQIVLRHGVLSLYTYKNVLKLGLALQEYDWVEAYLEAFKQYLHPEQRENNYLHNLAVFYFSKRDYAKAMSLLQQVTFQDKLHELDARRMLLRMYYELQEFDALESLLESFQTYIRRQKNIGYHQENYINLIRIMKKMLRTNLDNKTNQAAILQAIHTTKALAERGWLLEQLNG
ncbi:MAG: hypothetical protein AAF985_11755 [Bacteroidota bacterium]